MRIRPPRAALAFATAAALCLSLVAVGPASGVGPASTIGVGGAPLPAPAAAAPTFRLVGTYITDDDPDTAGGEVAALRGTRAYVINGTSIELVDVSDPSAPVKTGAIDLSAYGASVTSVAVGPFWVAASLPAADKTAPGNLVLFRHDGSHIRSTQVGALPDMVTFDPTGLRVLVANEGEPNSYGQPDSVDPVGSVSVVNALFLAVGISGNVRTIEFTDFNTGGPRAGELPAGVRIFGPGASVAQDLEPEYITLDAASPLRAFVTLQENNAVAELDLARMRVKAIRALGSKDHSVDGNGFDASDRDEGVNIATWPVKALYMPDGIASYRTKGSTYLVTANEGDAREWDGFVEAVRVGASSYVLDPVAYPNAAELKNNPALGRLNVTTATGKNAAGTAFDSITAFGGRSFTIWSSDGNQVWDSGDDFERITAEHLPDNFNSNNDENSFDTRSDDKGPEPEGVAVGEVDKRQLAFVVLERVGGMMIYDVTDPTKPVFLQYLNNRVFTGEQVGPDSGPEVVKFVSAGESPNGKPLVLVSNEISGTVSFYQPTSADGSGMPQGQPALGVG